MLCEIKPGLTGHHHIQNDKIEFEAGQLSPGFAGMLCRGDVEPVGAEIVPEQPTQSGIVIDDQNMG